MKAEAIDRLDIIELLARYHHAVDAKDWSNLQALFTDRAVAEYRGLDTTKDLFGLDRRIEGRDAIVQWIEVGQAPFQYGGAPTHFMTNHVIEQLDEGTARTRSAFFDLDMVTGLLFGSGYYTVKHARTPEGWRIASLLLEQRLADNALQRILEQRSNNAPTE
ncbi:MAG: nuclear transport factor 2 family protein [Acidimicrobiales bacterium]